jgi:hypothetical protein
VFDWADAKNTSDDQTSVFWLHGNSRFATTNIAQRVAMRAQNEGRLLSSFFFSWTGGDETRVPAHLIPTVMYKIAQFDKDFLRRISISIGLDRDLRDKPSSQQILQLLKQSFAGAMMPSLLPPLLVVIDAMDACKDLDKSEISDEVGSFLKALAGPPFFAKFLVTSRFGQVIRRLFGDSLAYRSSPLHKSTKIQSKPANHISPDDMGM